MLIAHAQNCTVTYPLGQQGQSQWVDGELLSDGSMIGVLGYETPTRYAVAIKLDQNGQAVWSTPLIHSDAGIFLKPQEVLSNSNGRYLVLGEADHGNYTNNFGVQLDPLGNVEWARFYMHTSWHRTANAMALDQGRYFLGTQGGHMHELDMNGVPSVGIRTIFGSEDSDLIAANDGGRVYSGNHSSTPYLLRMDSIGQPVWGKRYELGVFNDFTSVTEAANGDLLFAGYSNTGSGIWGTTLMRLDGSGNFLWAKTYGLTEQVDEILELANGDILLSTAQNWSFDPTTLIHTSSSGIPINSWSNSSSTPRDPINLISQKGDSVIIGITQSTSLDRYPAIAIADDVAALGCGLTGTVVGHSVIPAPTNITDTLNMSSSILKTWTMSLLTGTTGGLDVQAGLASGPARPGFQFNYYGSAFNTSAFTSGTLDATFTFDPVLNFDTASPPGYTVNGNTIYWSGLPPLSSLDISTVSIAFQVPANVALLGDTLNAILTVSQDSAEVDYQNNTTKLSTIITGAYDPNDKLVYPENVYDPTMDSLLNYTIRFQNTGSDTAFTVVVVDTLPEFVSVGSFKQGPSSHPYTYELNAQGILTFTFGNILLPDSNVNEAASHGLVSFSVEPDDNLAIGTLISNSGDIYFDFNPPIRTPPADVIYGIVAGVPLEFKNEEVSVYPVPVQHALTALLPEEFRAETLTLTSLDGRLVATNSVQQVTNKLLIPVEQLAAGAYVLTLIDSDGKRLGARFVKE